VELRKTADYNSIPPGKTFEELTTSPQGLSRSSAEDRLRVFGPNEVEEKRPFAALLLAARRRSSLRDPSTGMPFWAGVKKP
jgi:hypothetical protein